MLKPVKKAQLESESGQCELTHLQLLQAVGSLDEHRRVLLKDRNYQLAADERLEAIREQMMRDEDLRRESQEKALLEQSARELERRKVLEQLDYK